MKTVKYLIIITVGFCMAIFLYQTDFRSVGRLLHTIGYQILWVIPTTALAYFFGTLSWQAYLRDKQIKIGILKLFLIRQIGETVGLFNPTSIVGGDFTKVLYLRKLQISERSATNSVIASRMTMVLSQVLLSTIALIWLLYYAPNALLSVNLRYALCLVITLLVMLQIGLFYWVYRKHESTIQSDASVHTSRIGRIKHKIALTLFDFRVSFRSDKKAFFRSYLYALLHWIVGSMEFYVILSCLGVNIALMQSILLDMGVILVKSVGAFIPGQMGIEELGNKIMLASVGVHTISVWISVSLLRRFRQLVWAFIGGLAYFTFMKKENIHYATSK